MAIDTLLRCPERAERMSSYELRRCDKDSLGLRRDAERMPSYELRQGDKDSSCLRRVHIQICTVTLVIRGLYKAEHDVEGHSMTWRDRARRGGTEHDVTWREWNGRE